MGLTTSLNYYQSLSKELTESLEERATSLITVQNQLDSLAAMVLQNRRWLDLLMVEKEGLCLFLEETCCFYHQQIRHCKRSSKKLTNSSSRIHQNLSNSWENWPNSWNWIPCIIPFLGLFLLLALILAFGPCLMLFSKILQDHLQAFTNQTIHELLLTHSKYQKFDPTQIPLTYILAFSYLTPTMPLFGREQLRKTDPWPLS